MRLLAPLTLLKSAVSSFVTSLAPVRNTVVGWIKESFPGAWQRNVEVDSMNGLTANAAVYACISRIANDCAKIGMLLKKRDKSIWSTAEDNSPFWKVLRKPNGFQNRIQFIAYWLICKLLYGNAYALKARDERRMVSALYLLDPRKVVPLITSDGEVYYQLGADDLARTGTGRTVPASEIIHDRINCLWHPLVGVSPLYAAGMAASQARRIQQNSAKFFENMSRPSGMLTAPATIDPITAERLKAEWNENFSGGNIGKLAVLGDGLKYEPMTIPPETAQLVEQLNWTVVDVARPFHMPLYKIGAAPVPAGSSVEVLNQQYYSECLQIHLEAIEACLDEGLALPADMRTEFDLDDLLRMDQSAQMTMLGEGVKNGFVAANEARARINLGPVAGGDSPMVQQQNYSLAALAKRDAKADPFGGTAPPAAPPPATPAPEPAPEPAKELALAGESEMRALIEKFTTADALG